MRKTYYMKDNNILLPRSFRSLTEGYLTLDHRLRSPFGMIGKAFFTLIKVSHMAEVGLSSLSEKGQVRIPKEIRRRLKLKPRR